MKINRAKCRSRGRQLCHVNPGSTVSFCKQFHQDHCLDDIFLVVNHNGYLDRHPMVYDHRKSVIVNISTGKMSVVDNLRECYNVKGEFCVHDHGC